MAGVTNRDAIPVSQYIDNMQVQFFVVGGIRAARMKKDELLLAQNFHRVIDFFQRAHPSRQQNRFASLARVAQ